MTTSAEILRRARAKSIAVPAFNVAYLPMIAPAVQAVVDADSFALIETAAIEWTLFGSQSLEAVAGEYRRWEQPGHVRLHLDHLPAVDANGCPTDVADFLSRAAGLGYQSAMLDASSLPFEGNLAASRHAAKLAHQSGLALEAELGAVLGLDKIKMTYDELFESGQGFTRVDEAVRFVSETGVDWLAVAVGSIHGALTGALKDAKKVEGRLNLERLAAIQSTVACPLVLHGGSGVRRSDVLAAVQNGIAKINIGFELRSAYEAALRSEGQGAAQVAVYERATWVIRDYFGIAGSQKQLL
jgi:ketose-bisphosphate aldolase